MKLTYDTNQKHTASGICVFILPLKFLAINRFLLTTRFVDRNVSEELINTEQGYVLSLSIVDLEPRKSDTVRYLYKENFRAKKIGLHKKSIYFPLD